MMTTKREIWCLHFRDFSWYLDISFNCPSNGLVSFDKTVYYWGRLFFFLSLLKNSITKINGFVLLAATHSSRGKMCFVILEFSRVCCSGRPWRQSASYLSPITAFTPNWFNSIKSNHLRSYNSIVERSERRSYWFGGGKWNGAQSC